MRDTHREAESGQAHRHDDRGGDSSTGVSRVVRRAERPHLRPARARGRHRLLRSRGRPRRRAALHRDGGSRCRNNAVVKWPLVLALLAAALLPSAAPGAVRKPWLWQCTQIHNAEVQYHCYVRLLRLDIEASGDPARELPRIDRRVARVGGPVEAGCHVLMHEVGRDYGRDHHVTLATLQRYVPRSNNPNCSAGFGMGLVMYLGPEILRSGGAVAVRTCARLPTRYRQYTCVHGLGHALMRAYHGNLGQAVRMCRKLRPEYAPDCAQGAFHDYWISLRGADGTTRPRHALTSPRVVCDGRFTYVRQCWYRYFLVQQIGLQISAWGTLQLVMRG